MSHIQKQNVNVKCAVCHVFTFKHFEMKPGTLNKISLMLKQGMRLYKEHPTTVESKLHNQDDFFSDSN